MNTLLQDLRYGVRMLAKAPGFTLIAVMTLALGIGANTAIFSVVDAVLISPLPYPHAEQLVSLYWARSKAQQSSIPYPNFLDWQKQNNSFASLAGYDYTSYNMTGGSEPERLVGLRVSSNYFSTLEENPILGRTFRPEEDQLGAGPVALLGEGFWKREFASSAGVAGQSITLDGTVYTIIGVAPDTSLIFGTPADVFTPLGQWDEPLHRDRRIALGTIGIGRLKPGVNFNEAQADMDTVAKNLATEYPAADAGTGVYMVPLKSDIVGGIGATLYVLLGAVAFVLLIACANVANLLLARSVGRAREFAIRAALGATPGRVTRQLLTESVLLSVSGGALGILLAYWGTRAAMSAVPQALPRAAEIGLNSTVLIFTFAISILAGVVFGLAPALKTSQPDLHDTLKEGGRGGSGARHRTQSVFVVAEMALAIVLLAGAGLMIRSLEKLSGIHPGFEPRNALKFNAAFSAARMSTPARIRESYRELIGKFEEVPGVEAASPLAGGLPLAQEAILPFWREGAPKPASENDMTRADWYAVGPGYLKAMGIPLERGRFIGATDTENSPAVVVIDTSFARQYYPNQNPIGQRINLGVMNVVAEIVGVAGRVRQTGLNLSADRIERVQLYVPLMQMPDRLLPLVAGRGSTFIVRTAGEPSAFTGAIRAASTKFDSQQVLYGFTTLDQIVSNSIAAQRFSMILLGAFAALALLLSAVGIFGVVSYLAGQRTHEIGVRLALGAQRRDVMQLILSEGSRMALTGVGIGIVAALALTRLMSKLLYGVSAEDPLTFAGVAVLLTIVALAACYVPARRAMKVDPIVALRYE
ncbi:MAG TPA: ABC transporter permease [Candidatus Acidoferrales bacterium]|nr:ABC transporter permease [Candidatus Acidoferrales bacterium]